MTMFAQAILIMTEREGEGELFASTDTVVWTLFHAASDHCQPGDHSAQLQICRCRLR